MSILVNGANGQLGLDVVRELTRRGKPVIGLDHTAMDVTDPNSVNAAFERCHPETVIRCAAWTNVDQAEDTDRRLQVYAANVLGTQYVAEACERCGSKMIYLSSDYVFHGQGTQPWQPEDEPGEALNVYGQTKREGEQCVIKTLKRFFVVRTSWLYGVHGRNFVQTILRLADQRDCLRVVNDQFGRPTYTRDLARLLADMADTERYGIYHATNEGEMVSWADFASEILAMAGKNTRVIPVTTEEYGSVKAARPHNSRLDTSKLAAGGFLPLPAWKDALKRYLSELNGSWSEPQGREAHTVKETRESVAGKRD